MRPASSGSAPPQESAPPRRRAAQLARFAGIGDPLRYHLEPQRHAREEPQRANRQVQRRPRNALRHQLDLEGAYVFQSEAIWRVTEITAELRNRVDLEHFQD